MGLFEGVYGGFEVVEGVGFGDGVQEDLGGFEVLLFVVGVVVVELVLLFVDYLLAVVEFADLFCVEEEGDCVEEDLEDFGAEDVGGGVLVY